MTRVGYPVPSDRSRSPHVSRAQHSVVARERSDARLLQARRPRPPRPPPKPRPPPPPPPPPTTTCPSCCTTCAATSRCTAASPMRTTSPTCGEWPEVHNRADLSIYTSISIKTLSSCVAISLKYTLSNHYQFGSTRCGCANNVTKVVEMLSIHDDHTSNIKIYKFNHILILEKIVIEKKSINKYKTSFIISHLEPP